MGAIGYSCPNQLVPTYILPLVPTYILPAKKIRLLRKFAPTYILPANILSLLEKFQPTFGKVSARLL